VSYIPGGIKCDVCGKESKDKTGWYNSYGVTKFGYKNAFMLKQIFCSKLCYLGFLLKWLFNEKSTIKMTASEIWESNQDVPEQLRRKL
jgi:endogenous inhibitor of DNA gyrase (YacG/DUF329 family)